MKTILRLLLATAVICGALGTVTSASASPAPYEAWTAPSASVPGGSTTSYEDAVSAYSDFDQSDVASWSEADTAAAIADATARGTVTPQKSGGTMITATYRGATATPGLTVTVDPTVAVVPTTTSFRNLSVDFAVVTHTYTSALRLARTALRGIAVVHGNGRFIPCQAWTSGWSNPTCTELDVAWRLWRLIPSR